MAAYGRRALAAAVCGAAAASAQTTDDSSGCDGTCIAVVVVVVVAVMLVIVLVTVYLIMRRKAIEKQKQVAIDAARAQEAQQPSQAAPASQYEFTELRTADQVPADHRPVWDHTVQQQHHQRLHHQPYVRPPTEPVRHHPAPAPQQPTTYYFAPDGSPPPVQPADAGSPGSLRVAYAAEDEPHAPSPIVMNPIPQYLPPTGSSARAPVYVGE
eukprot:TRINITY_DN4995_c0_g1_i1.p1 TRINITY_DN4995_c0_g1~~TRINITY_DN4995_c0_g1_i1.p1  ORF type:complete len:231 (+),score=63.15 TRINITY_DN4995_c0_g1_i1:58-693(+)